MFQKHIADYTVRSSVSGQSASAAPKSVYRPAIDGLRAIAVLAVIVNHLKLELLPFGHLGVDVFFVISGFVVTLSLLERPSLNAKQFLIGFYSRRVRRLFPALLVVVLCCSSLALLLTHPGSQERLTSLQTGMASFAGVSNIFLLTQRTDYFGISAQMNMFLHTWSLGVEEQFYLLFPLLWLLVSRSKIKFALLILVLALASAWLQHSFLGQDWGFSPAFYLMPSRFWELASGVLLAMVGPSLWRMGHHRIQKFFSHFLAPLCIAGLLLLLSNGFGEGMLDGVPITVLAVLLLVFCLEGDSPSRRVLSNSWMVSVGVRSYGLYLWHWPLIVLSRWIFPVNYFTGVLIVSLTFGLAWWLFSNVENPLRRTAWRSSPSGDLALGALLMGTATILVGGMARAGKNTAGMYFPPPAFPHLAYAPEIPNSPIDRKSCFKRFSFTSDVALRDEDLRLCSILPLKPGAKTFFLAGDSFAAHLSPLLSRLRQDEGIGVEVLLRAQCPLPSRTSDPTDDCTRFEQVRFERLLSATKPGDVVLLASSSRERGGLYSEHFLERLGALVDQLRLKSVRVVMQSPIPRYERKIEPICRYPLRWFQWNAEVRCARPNHQSRIEAAERIDPLLNQLQSLSDSHGLEVWDSFTPLCPKGTETCSTHQDGVRLYRDHAHLSAKGAEYLYPSFLDHLQFNAVSGLRGDAAHD